MDQRNLIQNSDADGSDDSSSESCIDLTERRERIFQSSEKHSNSMSAGLISRTLAQVRKPRMKARNKEAILICLVTLSLVTVFWLISLRRWSYLSHAVFGDGCSGCTADLGPAVKTTQGAIWPKPKFEKRYDFSFTVDPKNFEFQVTSHDCPILRSAIDRYMSLMESSLKYGTLMYKDHKETNLRARSTIVAQLPSLTVELKNPCEAWPSDKMDESYDLTLTHNSQEVTFNNSLVAKSIWGILRGLESFSQILVPNSKGTLLLVDGILISDSPRFPYRGLLLDTGRSFMPIPDIQRMLDGMAYSKMNVFHWHIVDDQSFPYQSSTFPELSAKGAFNSELAVYNHSAVISIIEYARDRGIRVIPEFDTPGHTRSWGEGIKGLLAKCDGDDNKYGPIDPTKEKNYDFLSRFFGEVASVFKDRYVHLGGDEVDSTCWKENESIVNFMKSHHMENQFSLLQAYFFSRLDKITRKLNLLEIVWEDVFHADVPLDKQTIVHMWKVEDTSLIKNVVSKGYQVVYSACWYLDDLNKSWKSFYSCDPLDFQGSAQEKALVIGGEACMWGEKINKDNVSPRIWPRACSTAERLWSYGGSVPSHETEARIEEHYCRLKRRGVPSSTPNGPSYCPVLP